MLLGDEVRIYYSMYEERLDVGRPPEGPVGTAFATVQVDALRKIVAVAGGAIYTALDCLSTWVATLLGPNRGAAWVLRSAAADAGVELVLVRRIRHAYRSLGTRVRGNDEKKKDRRLVRMAASLGEALRARTVRSVPGGFLLQEADIQAAESLRVVTRRAPTPEEMRGLQFAWRVAKHVKSNAIVYTGADRTLGIGAGQMSRVDSSRIAAAKAQQAGLSLKGSVVASDAYFPFPDGLLEAVRAGATAVIQPGGSVRDAEVIAAADEHAVAMVFTGVRHFRH